MRPVKKRKCKHCRTFFLPDARNATHQEYCCKAECRKASKRASQRKWLKKPENRDYFRGSENVRRVKQWRSAHPCYWRRKPSKSKTALQDLLIVQPAENNKDTDKLASTALQDLLTAQPFVLLGLIANFTDTALQDNIDITLRRLQQLGRDIAQHYTTCSKGGLYGIEVSYPSPTCAPCASTVQLGRPATGP
jgi:hypothetical protein